MCPPACRITDRRSTAASRRSSSADGVRRTALAVPIRELGAAHRARLYGRVPELGHQQLGRDQAPHRWRPCRVRAVRAHSRHRHRDARGARFGNWPEVGRQMREEWENRKRLAPGVTTPGDRATDRDGSRRRAEAAKICGAAAAAATSSPTGPLPRSAAVAGAGARVLDYRVETEGLVVEQWITRPIARVFAEIADLLEIKNENPFRVRAYRTAAETIATLGERVADLPAEARLKLPGIGKDLAARSANCSTPARSVSPSAPREFPPTVLDLLRCRCRAEDRSRCCTDPRNQVARRSRGGRARRTAARIKGWATRRRAHPESDRRPQAAGQPATDERRQRAAAALVGIIRHAAPKASLTRLAACGAAARPAATSTWSSAGHAGGGGGADRVVHEPPASGDGSSRGETSPAWFSRWASGGPARRRARQRRSGAPVFTGSRPHNIALRDRALGRAQAERVGLNEQGRAIAGKTEESIYRSWGWLRSARAP